MEKNKRLLNIIIITISAIIVVLLSYILFFKKSDIIFSITNKDILVKIGEPVKINYELNKDLVVNWSSNNGDININENNEIIANTYGSAIITGKVSDDKSSVTDTCIVKVYSGDIGVNISDITIDDGILLMKDNSDYEIPFIINPNNSYITSIEYNSSNPMVAKVDNNKIVSINEGVAIITMTVNNNISKEIKVVVSNKVSINSIIKEIDKVILKDKEITMEMGDNYELLYDTDPSNGYIENIEYISSDDSIVSVMDGVLSANNTGEVTVKIIINNNITDEMVVKVKSSKADIKIDKHPKTTIRIGEKTNVISHIEPVINDKVVYKSSNPMVATVDNGVITGVSSGTAIINLSIDNGKTKTYQINVLPKSGSHSGAFNLWGYKSLNSKTPVLADMLFFQKLASNGIGILQGNTYIINTSNGNFSYDITSNLLTINNKKVKMRIYYPPGEDLSSLNTLTFMGGRGETNFGSLFTDIKNNPSMVKNSGILILIAEGASFDGESGAYSTMFVKAITKQKAGVKNSILGFSDGAHKVMHASSKMYYDRIIVFSGYTDGVDSLDNAKNSEVMFIIAPNDGNYSQAQNALRHMMNSGYNNVTIISNGSDMIKLFSHKFLVITPGNIMKNGHLTENILLSGMIEYLND